MILGRAAILLLTIAPAFGCKKEDNHDYHLIVVNGGTSPAEAFVFNGGWPSADVWSGTPGAGETWTATLDGTYFQHDGGVQLSITRLSDSQVLIEGKLLRSQFTEPGQTLTLTVYP